MNKTSKNTALLIAGLCATTTAVIVGCGGGSSGASTGSSPSPSPGPSPSPAGTTYLLGGTVTGLRDGDSITIANGSDSVAVSRSGSFTFPAKLASGANYKVSLSKSPGYDCRLSNEAATVSTADVTAITVQCMPFTLAGKEAALRNPTGLAVDADGNAYVADYDYHVIQKITPAGEVSVFAGAKKGGAGHVDGPAGEARFYFDFATAMTIDRDGSLIVAERCNQSIRKVTKAGLVSTVAGAGVGICNYYPKAPKDGVGSDVVFDSMQAIALDVNGDYLIGGGQNTIRRVTPAGVVSTIRLTSPALVGSPDRLEYATQLTVDKNGTIYSVTNNSRVWKVAGGVATPFAGGALDAITAASGVVNPRGLTSDKSGNLYISGDGRVQRISADGTISKIAGAVSPFTDYPSPPPDVVDGTGVAARFPGYSLLAMNAAGNVVAMDRDWQALRYITPQGIVTTNPGTPVEVQTRDGVGGAARFSNYAVGMTPAVDANGNIFIADWGTVRMVTPDGTVSRHAGTLGVFGAIDGSKDNATLNLSRPMVADNAGNLYLLDSIAKKVRKIRDGTVSTLFQRPEFSAANAFAISAGGNFAVALRDTVKVYSQDGTVLATIDSARIFSSLRSTARAPVVLSALVYDSSGNLFVSDTANSVIYELSKEGAISTFAGKPGVSGSADGPPGTGTLMGVQELTVDPSGNLYTFTRSEHELGALRRVTPLGVISTLQVPWENPPSSGVAYGNGRLYAMSRNALMQMALP